MTKEKITLKNLRDENKKSRAEVARALGVTSNAVTNYESGIRRISLEQILILAEVYQVSEKEIIQAQLNSRPNDQ